MAYIPTVPESTMSALAARTLDEALAQWSRGRIIEAVDEPRDALVRFYVDNGFDPRGWYVRRVQLVNIRTKYSKRDRSWECRPLIFNGAQEYTQEVK